MSTFAAAAVLPSKPNAAAHDNVLPSCGLLNRGGMTHDDALAGTKGADVMLVHQNVWEQLEQDKFTNILGSLTTDITKNETWTVHGNLVHKIVGTTQDDRIGTHFQNNNKPRFDHFLHTRTETHDQPQVVNQPTEDTHTVAHFLEWHIEKHAVTGLYMVANGIKLEVDLTEATAKGVVVDYKKIHWKNKEIETALGIVKVKIKTFVTEVLPVKLNAAATHLKAVGANLAAGIRSAFSMPWGS